MKKIIIGSAFLLIAAQISNAQISIDPEAGVNLSNLPWSNGSQSPDQTYSHSVGLRLGASATINVQHGFFFQAGLFYSVKGTEMEYNDSYYRYKGTLRLNYLELPLNVGYQYKIGGLGSLFATAGPYLGYAFSGSLKGEAWTDGVYDPNPPQNGAINFGSNGAKRLDAGFNFGFGYKAPVGVYVKAQYGLGLAHVMNSFFGSGRVNRGYSFTVGYQFKVSGNKKYKFIVK